MEMTLEELKDKLARQFDECSIIDLLELNSFELVEYLSERVEEKYDKLIREISQDAEEAED